MTYPKLISDKFQIINSKLPPIIEKTGQSQTSLPDGRKVFIGGTLASNEKSSTYHDIIVKYPDDELQIIHYSPHIFPSISFHTATLVSDKIWIIGGVNNLHKFTSQHTSVYQLNIHNFNIQYVEIRNNINLIAQHTVTLKNNQLIVSTGKVWLDTAMIWWENIDTWALNLTTFIWKNITKRRWQCFAVKRKDHDLLQCRLLTGDLLEQLFNPPIRHEVVPHILYHRPCDKMIIIDDIKIRYVTEANNVQVYIEGILSEEIVELLQENLRHKLSKAENFPCDIHVLI